MAATETKDIDKEELKEEALAKEAECESAEEDAEETPEASEDGSEAEEGSAEDGSGDAGEEESQTEKKGLFKKKEKKNKQEEKIAELNDRVQRQMAEFDNFRKRTEKEKAQMFEVGAKSIIEKILPVVDNFERGLSAVPEEAKGDPFVEGMDKIYKQLMTELESLEVKPIEAVGTEFDPEFHNAVMQVESDEFDSGVVAQELQRGYTYRDSVVRHSMVAVVQ
ncbi:MAG: nucleotide exchange factor GrpE [Lachnospiraceae bacterium]|nr:nucleotide exchange factor GrpE [Lachnospiraceae bacterium]